MDVDEDIPLLLEQWELLAYTATFEANKITLSTLPMLDNSMIKELIAPIGDRARFLKNLENWKNITKTHDDPETDITTSTPVDFVDILNPRHKKIMSISELMPIDDRQQSSSTISEEQTDSTWQTNPEIIFGSTEPDLSSTVTINNEDNTVPCYLPLKNLLMKTYDGQGLLNLYAEEGKLTNNGRRKLCNIIIRNLMESDPSKRVESSLLLEKAQEIKDVFKKENISTYFIPYINDSKLKIKRCAKGKLYDCLQNRRRELRETKVIPRNKGTTSNTTLNTSNESHETDATENCNDDIQWLQNCTEPWHTVAEKWQRTARHRLNELSSSNMSIAEYLSKFPILKIPRGHELLTADFKFMYPSSDNKLNENFPVIKQRLFNMALSKCQLTEVKEILEQLQLLKKDDENHEEIESILAFMLLPLLLGNPTHKGKKNVWRPSKAEVTDGFITHVQRPMDLQDTIAKRREKYLLHNLTFQPIIVIVGPKYSDIHKYYVVVNDLLFETQSILNWVHIQSLDLQNHFRPITHAVCVKYLKK